MLPTLHGYSEGLYEVAPLMAPKTISPGACAFLHHQEWGKVVECWRLGGICGWGVGSSTLYLIIQQQVL